LLELKILFVVNQPEGGSLGLGVQVLNLGLTEDARSVSVNVVHIRVTAIVNQPEVYRSPNSNCWMYVEPNCSHSYVDDIY
jgi:hypothetical protein